MINIHPEYQYLDLVKDILKNGTWKISHSTGVKLKSVFGRQIRFDLSKGFPLLTTKKVFWRGIAHELLWFLSGTSNIKYLVDNNVHIWDNWAYKNYKVAITNNLVPKMGMPEFIEKIKTNKVFAKKWGELGPIYGTQWRRWKDGKREVDQLGWVLEKIKKFPQKKHYLVSAWNAGYIYEMAPSKKESMIIAPCHTLYHIVLHNGKLCLQLYQRSADLFLGVPFNIASYALLTMMLAQVTGYPPGDFVHTFGDVHIYENHFEQVKEQLSRAPRPFPKMILNPKIKNIDDFKFADFTLENYNPYPPIKAKITVVGGF